MPTFKFDVLKKVNSPIDAETELAKITTFPKYIVVKKPYPQIVEYLVCVPFVGSTFDRQVGQPLTIIAPHKIDQVNQAAAVLARNDIPDGLVVEKTNKDLTVSVYSNNGNFFNNMIAQKKRGSNIGGNRAEEGWPPPSIKPTGLAFNDSQLGVSGAEDAGFGKELG